MFSYFEPNCIEKFLWESGFSNFGQYQNVTRNKNRLFGRYFETVQYKKKKKEKKKKHPELWFIGPTYMVQKYIQNVFSPFLSFMVTMIWELK